MTSFYSEKIRIISFFSIVMVLYIHTGFPDSVMAETMSPPVILRACIAGVFGPCAVPLFYVISGYLFFLNIRKKEDVRKKVLKRAKTLLLPFVIASLLFPLFYVVLELVPGASNYINSDSYIVKLSSLPFSEVIKSLFFDCGNGRPWAYHLWFLRDLIIIVAITPLLYTLRRRMGGGILLLLAVTLYIVFNHIQFLYGMIWFVAGGFFLDKVNGMPRKVVCMMSLCFICMAIIHQITDYSLWKYFKIIEISLGICSLWGIYDMVVPKDFQLDNAPFLQVACQFTFFIYLYHEPGYHIVVKGLPLLIGDTSFGYCLTFILSPIIFIPICVFVGYLLKKYSPYIYKILVGGR